MSIRNKLGWFRVGAAIPEVRVADPDFNARTIISLVNRAWENDISVLIFPELFLTGYSLGDLVHQRILLERTLMNISYIARNTNVVPTIFSFGAPLCVEGNQLLNCAITVYRGKILGIVPKSYLPSYSEFNDRRYYTSGIDCSVNNFTIDGVDVPLGRILFRSARYKDFVLATEICEDMWAPVSPGTLAALEGATIIGNLSASTAGIGKHVQRHKLCVSHSLRSVCAYLYCSSGMGESSADLAWESSAIICENGTCLADKRYLQPKEVTSDIVFADIDCEYLNLHRLRASHFNTTKRMLGIQNNNFKTVIFDEVSKMYPSSKLQNLESSSSYNTHDFVTKHTVSPFPFIPIDNKDDNFVHEVFNIQSRALLHKINISGITKSVIGVSGGIDSTYTLLLTVFIYKMAGLPISNITACILPAFGTSDKTYNNSIKLAKALGVNIIEVNMEEACKVMMRDIGHPGEYGDIYSHASNITYENIQAGARTSFLFRLANLSQAIVLGTSDLSEIALGWCTYGVGDHMSHYNINCSLPKTAMIYIISMIAKRTQYFLKDAPDDLSNIIIDILGTDISPELVPINDGSPQKTEDTIGPYVLHDFFLYYTIRNCYTPTKLVWLATYVFSKSDVIFDSDITDIIDSMKQYGHYTKFSYEEILKWLKVFYTRFFLYSQFKRSVSPDGPKIYEHIGLSPRSLWRVPTDICSKIWMNEIDNMIRDSQLKN